MNIHGQLSLLLQKSEFVITMFKILQQFSSKMWSRTSLASRPCPIHICSLPWPHLTPAASLFGSCIYYFVFFQWSRLSHGIELEWEFQLHRKVNFLAIGQIKTLTSFKSYVISSDKIILSKVLRVPKFRDMLEFAQTCQIRHLCLNVWHKVQF